MVRSLKKFCRIGIGPSGFYPSARRVALLCVFFAVFGSLSGQGSGSPDSGRVVMREADANMYRLNDQSAEVIFTLIDQDGKKLRTELDLFWKNFHGKEGIRSKTLLITTSPPSERGESFLLWERTDPKESEYWLYLPNLRQTRKIQKPSVEDALRESDLIFEDMRRIPLEDMDFEVLMEEPFQGERCLVIEARPPADSPYGKKVYWVSKEKRVFLKIEFYDRLGKKLKTQTISWSMVKDQPVWKQSRIENRQTRRTTEILLRKVRINTELADRMFSSQELSRGIRR